jgi:hypothetical protein
MVIIRYLTSAFYPFYHVSWLCPIFFDKTKLTKAYAKATYAKTKLTMAYVQLFLAKKN